MAQPTGPKAGSGRGPDTSPARLPPGLPAGERRLKRSQAARLVPGQGDEPLTRASLARWVRRGWLEWEMKPGRVYVTTAEAVERALARQGAREAWEPPPPTPDEAAFQRGLAQARREWDRIIPGRGGRR